MITVPELFDNMILDMVKFGKKPKKFVLSMDTMSQVVNELNGERKYRGIPVNFSIHLKRGAVYLLPKKENEHFWEEDKEKN